MRSLVYFVAVTLDGRIAGPDGSADFFPVDEAYLADIAREWPDSLPSHVHEQLGTVPPRTRWDTVVMGRGTYQPALDLGIADPYRHLDTYVVSSTLRPADHPAVTIVDGDPAAFVAELKRRPGGDIWLCGGGRLAAALTEQIDRLVLKVSPVVAGAGIGLFEGAFEPTRWRLIDQQAHDLGVVVSTYERA